MCPRNSQGMCPRNSLACIVTAYLVDQGLLRTTPSVGAGRHLGPTGEGRGEVSGVGVAQSRGDRGEGREAILEQTKVRLQANLVDDLAVGNPSPGEAALELADAGADRGGHVGNGRMSVRQPSSDSVSGPFDEVRVLSADQPRRIKYKREVRLVLSSLRQISDRVSALSF